MARINTNVSAVIAQRHLGTSYQKLNGTLERLSTGLRINRGKDDPAGLIVSEQLRSEVSALDQAIRNSQRASNIIATAEGALDEIANLLRTMQEKIVEAANSGALSEEEIRANQLQIDDSIASITRIANTTTFAGRNLLDGSLDYVISGADRQVLDSLKINGVQFGTRDYVNVDIDVTTSAQPAQVVFSQIPLPSAVTIEVQGNRGATTLSFAAGTTAVQVASAFNTISDATGVVATDSPSGSAVTIESERLGSSQFVNIQALGNQGTFVVTDVGGSQVTRDEGRDAIASVNGALTMGDGNSLTLKTATLDFAAELDQSFGLGSTSFSVTAGGAKFQIGPRINSNLQVNVGIQSVSASRLGTQEIGFLSQITSGGDYSLVQGQTRRASDIVATAIDQISILRGRLGALERNTLEANIAQLGITMENLSASESTIRDADFAQETSQLTRNQILVQSGTNTLQIANQIPQSVLQLLG
jgi:flagellin